MKLRVLLALAGGGLLALAWVPSASAQEFLDLPGMGAASKLVAGKQPDPGGAVVQTGAGAPVSTQQAVTTGGDASAASISDMPGMGAVAVIEAERAKVTLPGPGRNGLEAWAALGSFLALVGIYAARRSGVF